MAPLIGNTTADTSCESYDSYFEKKFKPIKMSRDGGVTRFIMLGPGAIKRDKNFNFSVPNTLEDCFRVDTVEIVKSLGKDFTEVHPSVFLKTFHLFDEAINKIQGEHLDYVIWMQQQSQNATAKLAEIAYCSSKLFSEVVSSMFKWEKYHFWLDDNKNLIVQLSRYLVTLLLVSGKPQINEGLHIFIEFVGVFYHLMEHNIREQVWNEIKYAHHWGCLKTSPYISLIEKEMTTYIPGYISTT